MTLRTFTASTTGVTGTNTAFGGTDSIQINGTGTGSITAMQGTEDCTLALTGSSTLTVGTTYPILATVAPGQCQLQMSGTTSSGTLTVVSTAAFTATSSGISGTSTVFQGYGSIQINGDATGTITAMLGTVDSTEALIGQTAIALNTTYSIQATAPAGTYQLQLSGATASGSLTVVDVEVFEATSDGVSGDFTVDPASSAIAIAISTSTVDQRSAKVKTGNSNRTENVLGIKDLGMNTPYMVLNDADTGKYHVNLVGRQSTGDKDDGATGTLHVGSTGGDDDKP